MPIELMLLREKERLSEELTKLDAERARLQELLAELDIAERVLSRLAGRRPSAEPAQPPRLTLGEAVLHAVAAHPQGISAAEIRAYLAAEFAIAVRPNHLGLALHRQRRARRVEYRDFLWYPTASSGFDRA